MDKMQEMSKGWYRPSPGSIYPLLEQLVREGLVVNNKDGKYQTTAIYDEQPGSTGDVGSVLTAIESNVSYLEERKAREPGIAKFNDRIDKVVQRLRALRAA